MTTEQSMTRTRRTCCRLWTISLCAVTVAGAAPALGASPATGSRQADAEVTAWQARMPHPLWIANDRLRPEAWQLIALVRSVRLDGLDPDTYRIRDIERVVRKADGGDRRSIDRADVMLSQALVAIARDMRLPRERTMTFADDAAIAPLPSAGLLLTAAASAPSLQLWLAHLPWMKSHLHGLAGQPVRRVRSTSRASVAP